MYKMKQVGLEVHFRSNTFYLHKFKIPMFSISITHSGIVSRALFVLDLDLQSCKCITYFNMTDKCGNFQSMFESAKHAEF